MTHLWRLLRSLRTVLRALRRRTLGAGGACLVVLASLNRAAFSGAVESYVSWLGASAQRGDPDAQFLLALNRAKETGVPENLASAVAWYRELGGQGDPRGLAVVGAMYLDRRIGRRVA